MLVSKDKIILKYKKVMMIGFLFLFFGNSTMKRFTIRRNRDIKTVNKIRDEIKELPNTIKENEKIFFISNTNVDQGFYYWVYRYVSTPIKIQETYYDENIDLFEIIKEYDYLYLKDFDNKFVNKYSKLFKDNIELNSYYKVEYKNGEIVLIKLN